MKVEVEIGKCLICGIGISEFAEVCNACYSLVSAKRDELDTLRESEAWDDAAAQPLVRFFDQFNARRAVRWRKKGVGESSILLRTV